MVTQIKVVSSLKVKTAFELLKWVVSKGLVGFESKFKKCTKPRNASHAMNTLTDVKRSRRELIAENMYWRQQLIVLERQVSRPKLSQRDRQILVLLASQIHGWRDALVVVKLETLLGWHRRGFKLYWRRKSQRKRGRPPTSPEIIALIEEMAINNRLWQAGRIMS